MSIRRGQIEAELHSIRQRIATLQRKEAKLVAERKAIPRKKRAKTSGPQIDCWLPHEDQILRDCYPHGGIRACVKALPNRTRKAIQQQCYRLRIKRIKESERVRAAFVAPQRPRKPALTFEEQLARVERGEATVTPVFRPWIEPSRTLGGVSTEWAA